MASRGKKIALGLAIGCLGIPVLLAVLFGSVLLVGKAMYGNDPPPKPEPVSLTIPLGRAAPGKDLPELAPPAGTFDEPLRLTVDLEEGEFDVVTGPPGSDVKAEGSFDPKDYELVQETSSPPGGSKEIHISFRRKISMLELLFHSGEDNQNKVTVTIPKGVPTALGLKLRKGDSHVDLGGLMLTDLNVDMSMGDHSLGFSEPIVGKISTALLQSSMGDIKMTDLGNAHAETLGIRSSMGDTRLGFGGSWLPGFQTKATMSFTMGDVRVTVPDEVRFAPTSSAHVTLGDGETEAMRRDHPASPGEPSIEMNVSMMFGSLVVGRD